MTSRLFRVDMSEGSRDFMVVATEPGLAMLDSAGANYAILRRWFGPLAAEPEMQSPDLVSFYVREPEQGRLERLSLHTATVADLRGPLKQDLTNLETLLRKAKPESANEKLLYKIVAKTIKEQTADPEKSDFDCYFFKYRQGGGPWRLVWCWGYQRRDHEPSRAVICSNAECNRLFAHRPNTKRRCPNCQTIVTRKRRTVALGLWPGLLVALLLLAAVAGLLLVLNPEWRPWGDTAVAVKEETDGKDEDVDEDPKPEEVPDKLEVTPETVAMAEGERLDLEITTSDPKKLDVSSGDADVVQFIGKRTLTAGKAGQAEVTFKLGDLKRKVKVNVTGTKYSRLEIRPDKIALNVGDSHDLKIFGITADGRAIRMGAEQLTFRRQPSSEHVDLNRDEMQLRALKETSSPLPLEIEFAGVPVAKAEVSVAAMVASVPNPPTPGETIAAIAPTGGPVKVVDDAWSVYPPLAVARPGTVVTAGPEVGDVRFVPGQGLIADTIVDGSPLAVAGLAPGAVLSHIGGTDIRHYTPAQLSDLLAQKPIANGTVLGVVGADGKPYDVRLGIDVTVLEPVKVVGIVPANVSAAAFDAAVNLKVRDRADYRIVDDQGHEFGPWTTHGPSAEATIQIAQIPRSAGRNEYDMYVERRLGTDVKRYPFVISLSPR